MYARIIGNIVTETSVNKPELGTNECAFIVFVEDNVRVGWTWTPSGCIPPPTPDPNIGIDTQIRLLEATITNRRLREAALTDAGKVWLADVDAQINALRAQRV